MAKTFEFDHTTPVQTTAGQVKGFLADGCYSFRGVPYAQAKRFHAPEPPTPWEGVRETTTYGYVCPLLTQDKPSAELLVPHRYWPQDENCLSLNIWTTSPDAGARRPVIVWIHGGGFTAGSSIEQVAYDGAALCKFGDVVVVSLNHRLNVLGYLDLSAFGEQYKNSGNNGQADLVAGLEWVRDNIANFGGDPDNVTVWGQSGGGMKISALMQTPSADGLFHKAVIMSGVAGDLMPVGRGDGRTVVTDMLHELNLTEQDMDRLETIPYHDLAQAYNKVSLPLMMQGVYAGGVPIVNDWYLGEGPDVGFTDHANTIPTMVGTVFGEFAFRPLPYQRCDMTNEAAAVLLARRFGNNANEIVALFREAYPGRPDIDLLTLDLIFRLPTKQFVAEKAKGSAPIYAYLFGFDFPYGGGKTAWHCSDIPFFFHNIDKVDICCVPGVAEELEDRMAKALVQFARTGDPNHDALPRWPASTPDTEYTMIFDRTCRIGKNFDKSLLELNAKVSPKLSLLDIMMQQNVQH